MPYIMHDRDAMVTMGEDSPDVNAIQNAINKMEQNGFTLHSVVPQHHTWDAEGMPDGQDGPYFIFYSQDSGIKRSGSVW